MGSNNRFEFVARGPQEAVARDPGLEGISMIWLQQSFGLGM